MLMILIKSALKTKSFGDCESFLKPWRLEVSGAIFLCHSASITGMDITRCFSSLIFCVCLLVTSEVSFAKAGSPETQAYREHSDDAREIIDNIVDAVGLKSNFLIKAADIPNAAAVVYGGQRYILYNPRFIAAMDRAAGKTWASIAILAHEIGHHLNGHTLKSSGSQPHLELEADEFSGFVLQKMGASLQDAQLAMQIAGSARASHTHPAKGDRLLAIENGWTRSYKQMNGSSAGSLSRNSVPRVEQPREQAKQRSSSDIYIAYDVHFPADPASRYYVTNNNHFVKLEGSKLLLVGKLQQTDRDSYPLAIYNDLTPIFYINPKGVLYSNRGNKVGYINHHQKG